MRQTRDGVATPSIAVSTPVTSPVAASNVQSLATSAFIRTMSKTPCGHSAIRTMQRNPRWHVDVSIPCAIRAAGR